MNIEKRYEGLIRQAEKLNDKGKTEKAFSLINKAIDLSPEKHVAHVLLGDYHAEKQEEEMALKSYETALALNPNCAIANFQMGQYLSKHGSLQEALNYFKTSINIDPTHPEPFLFLICELITDGQSRLAYEFLLDALHHHPRNGKFNYLYAVLLILDSDKIGVKPTNEVLKHLDIAENKGISYASINGLRGEYFYQLEQWETAIKYLLKSLKAENDEDNAFKLAVCYYQCQKYHEMLHTIYVMKEKGSEFAADWVARHPEYFEIFREN